MDRVKFTSATDLATMPSRPRATLFNLLSGIQPAVVISTSNENGSCNLALFNSLTHIGSNPALLGVFFRPLSVERHTYSNLKRTGTFVVNHLPASMVHTVHQTSAKFERSVSEAERLELSTARLEGFEAPYLEDALISIGLRFEEEQLIQANETLFVIGRCEWIRWNGVEYTPDGFFDWEAWSPLLVAGLDDYFSAHSLVRLAYAEPNKAVEALKR